MQQRPTIANLANTSRLKLFYDSITRKHLIITAFIVLGLLSASLIVVVAVRARNGNKNDQESVKPTTTVNPTRPPASTMSTGKLCTTPGCVSAGVQQLRSMDSSASSDLCKDFYTYACGGWQKSHPIQSFDVERTILSDIINRRDKEVERLLDASVLGSDENSWEYKLKTYYSECLDDYARVTDSAQYMIGIIRDSDTIDGWFLFDNVGNVSQVSLLKNQTIYQQMSHIHGDFGALAVFGIRTRFDESDPTKKRLEFYPAGLTMEVNDYLGTDEISNSRRAALQLYIMGIAMLLANEAGINDTDLQDRAFTVANDVFTVEYFLANSLQNNPSPANPRTTNLRDMSSEYYFDFVNLMGHELDDPNVVSNSTPVYVSNPMYFTDAFEYITDDQDPSYVRMVHNYLRWRLVRTYIEDLSYKYIHLHRTYLRAYFGYALHTSNDLYCIREVERRFPLAIQRLYTRSTSEYTNAIATIENIVTVLKSSLKEYINQSVAWMPDQETKTAALNKIDVLTAAIGYATVASDDAALTDYYRKFVVGSESHLRNAYSYHYFLRWTLSNSISNPNVLDHWDLFETRTSRLFDYIAIFNRLFVIASSLEEPLVNPEWPWSVNMGSIGVLLAQKLFASIDMPDGRAHLPNGTRFDWWQRPTINGYNITRKCITDYYVNEVNTLTYTITGVPVQVRLAGEPFSPTTLRHIGALRVAYDAFMKNDNMKTMRIPGTNLTTEQTFFLSYAQTQCYQREDLLQLLRTQLGTYDERTALNAALIQMSEFSLAFNCQPKANRCLI